MAPVVGKEESSQLTGVIPTLIPLKDQTFIKEGLSQLWIYHCMGNTIKYQGMILFYTHLKKFWKEESKG